MVAPYIPARIIRGIIVFAADDRLGNGIRLIIISFLAKRQAYANTGNSDLPATPSVGNSLRIKFHA
jgi:hypothetical protein